MYISGRLLFSILVVILVAASSLFVVFTWKLRNAAENAFSSKLQADLLEVEFATISRKPIRIVLVGDIMLSREVGKIMEEKGDYTFPFVNVSKVLSSADIAFGNLEGPISSRGTDVGSKYSFRADPRVVEGLAFAGFDVLSVANNHIFDWGADALTDTVSLLGEEGISAVGAGTDYEDANRPVIKRVGGTSIGFLAYTNLYPSSLEAGSENPGVSDIDNAEGAVRNIGTDIVVVSLHWGDEYESSSSETQRELARRLIDAGADVVVGHHPHVIQEIEKYRNGWIAYSLGNFVFDQTFSEETKRGAAMRVRIEGKKVVDVGLIGVDISKTFQPTFVSL